MVAAHRRAATNLELVTGLQQRGSITRCGTLQHLCIRGLEQPFSYLCVFPLHPSHSSLPICVFSHSIHAILL